MFYCRHCNENRFGTELSNCYTIGKIFIQFFQCCSCGKTSQVDTDLSANKSKPPDITDGDE